VANFSAAKVSFQFSHGKDEDDAMWMDFMKNRNLRHSRISDQILSTGKAFMCLDSVAANQIVVMPRSNLGEKLGEIVFEPGE
jgi:uncharacterized membrane protein